MKHDNDWGDDCFYCMHCNKPFRTPLFSITRMVEIMHYFSDSRLPEAEILTADSIADYCSKSCINRNVDEVLKSERVRKTFPGSGPVEACSRCGAPVDMSQPHYLWSQDGMDFPWGDAVAQPFEATTLAIGCKQCFGGNEAADCEETQDGEIKRHHCIST